jgi:hypothetical protein
MTMMTVMTIHDSCPPSGVDVFMCFIHALSGIGTLIFLQRADGIVMTVIIVIATPPWNS